MRLIAFTIAALIAGACFVGSPGDPNGGGQAPPTQQRPGQQEDGTMTVEEFRTDINDAIALAEEYWQTRFRESGRRFDPVRRVLAYQEEGEIACGPEAIPANNAVYCPAGDFIAYDVDWAVVAFRRVGDAFLFYLLGHEYAHGIQVRLGINYEYTIQQELQADCLAGAYIGDLVKAGRLRLDEGDMDEFKSGLLAVADDPGQPWFAPGAHGSAQQRTEFFFRGFEGSISACGIN